MSDIPTVRIRNPVTGDGYTVINEADFDPTSHTLFDEDAAGGGPARPIGDGIFDDMSDEDLRAYITDRTGKAPHPRAKRETLIDKAKEI